MPKIKKVSDEQIIEHEDERPLTPKRNTEKEHYLDRQIYLIGLIEQLKAEGISAPTQLEVKLSQVNQQLGKL